MSGALQVFTMYFLDEWMSSCSYLQSSEYKLSNSEGPVKHMTLNTRTWEEIAQGDEKYYR